MKRVGKEEIPGRLHFGNCLVENRVLLILTWAWQVDRKIARHFFFFFVMSRILSVRIWQ